MKRFSMMALSASLMLGAIVPPAGAVTAQQYLELERREQIAYLLGAVQMALSIHRSQDQMTKVECIKDYFWNNTITANSEVNAVMHDPKVADLPAAGGIRIVLNRHCGKD